MRFKNKKNPNQGAEEKIDHGASWELVLTCTSQNPPPHQLIINNTCEYKSSLDVPMYSVIRELHALLFPFCPPDVTTPLPQSLKSM